MNGQKLVDVFAHDVFGGREIYIIEEGLKKLSEEDKEELGKRYGVTKKRIDQMINKIIFKLHKDKYTRPNKEPFYAEQITT